MVLLVASRLFHHIDGTVRFPLLVVAPGRARLVCVPRVLSLLLFLGIEGRLLGQGVTPHVIVLLILTNHFHLQLNHASSVLVNKILIESKRNLI
jgi:hypothetical protein